MKLQRCAAGQPLHPVDERVVLVPVEPLRIRYEDAATAVAREMQVLVADPTDPPRIDAWKIIGADRLHKGHQVLAEHAAGVSSRHLQRTDIVRNRLVPLALLLLAAGPCLGYTIVRKGGRRLEVLAPPEYHDGTVYFRVLNGMGGFMAEEDVDRAATERANAQKPHARGSRGKADTPPPAHERRVYTNEDLAKAVGLAVCEGHVTAEGKDGPLVEREEAAAPAVWETTEADPLPEPAPAEPREAR